MSVSGEDKARGKDGAQKGNTIRIQATCILGIHPFPRFTHLFLAIQKLKNGLDPYREIGFVVLVCGF